MQISKDLKEDILYAGQVIKKLVFKASQDGVSDDEYNLMISNSKYIYSQLVEAKKAKK